MRRATGFSLLVNCWQVVTCLSHDRMLSVPVLCWKPGLQGLLGSWKVQVGATFV